MTPDDRRTPGEILLDDVLLASDELHEAYLSHDSARVDAADRQFGALYEAAVTAIDRGGVS